jgi:ribonuclease HI
VGQRKPRRKGRATSDGERRQLARASRHARRRASMHAPECALLLCDGGSRGNPGPAAAAAVLVAPDGVVLARRALAIGRATAAEAEYRAILIGLELAAAHGADPLEIRSDSRLAIAAVEHALPADAVLAALVSAIRSRSGGFSAVRWEWHPRADNELADALVRELLWS